MQQLESILLENDRSMSRSVPIETKEQKQAWWTTRMHLDERLTDLLSQVNADYLGPWRYRLTSTTSTCHKKCQKDHSNLIMHIRSSRHRPWYRFCLILLVIGVLIAISCGLHTCCRSQGRTASHCNGMLSDAPSSLHQSWQLYSKHMLTGSGVFVFSTLTKGESGAKL